MGMTESQGWQDKTDDEKVLTWRPLFVSVARTMVDRLHDISDLVQMAMIGYYQEGMPEFVAQSRVKFWIINGLRKEYDLRSQGRGFDYLFLEQPFPAKDTIAMEDKDTRLIAEEMLTYQALSQRERLFLAFYYCDGWTLKRIGDAYDVSNERVRQILSLAIQKLHRKYLKTP